MPPGHIDTQTTSRLREKVSEFNASPGRGSLMASFYLFDRDLRIYAIEICSKEEIVNIWLFYLDSQGAISLIEVYGQNLRRLLNTIHSSMTVFGYAIRSAKIVRDEHRFLIEIITASS